MLHADKIYLFVVDLFASCIFCTLSAVHPCTRTASERNVYYKIQMFSHVKVLIYNQKMAHTLTRTLCLDEARVLCMQRASERQRRQRWRRRRLSKCTQNFFDNRNQKKSCEQKAEEKKNRCRRCVWYLRRCTPCQRMPTCTLHILPRKKKLSDFFTMQNVAKHSILTVFAFYCSSDGCAIDVRQCNLRVRPFHRRHPLATIAPSAALAQRVASQAVPSCSLLSETQTFFHLAFACLGHQNGQPLCVNIDKQPAQDFKRGFVQKMQHSSSYRSVHACACC